MFLILFRMGLFGAAQGWQGGEERQKVPLTKICHTYATLMKLGALIPYLKEIHKIYKSRDAHLDFC